MINVEKLNGFRDIVIFWTILLKQFAYVCLRVKLLIARYITDAKEILTKISVSKYRFYHFQFTVGAIKC